MRRFVLASVLTSMSILATAGCGGPQVPKHNGYKSEKWLEYILSELKVAPLMWIYVTNLLGIVFTLGLYYPWAKVRQTRYQLENMQVDSDGQLGAFTAGAAGGASAVGEEAGDFFDVDFGL